MGGVSDERAIRVFVSSTFRDMQLERDELVKRVFPQVRRLCEQRGVSWTEIDLRWGVTDEQKAEGAVLPICLAEIDRTRPYFIGLLGQRYGWVPDEIPADLVDQLGWLTDDQGRSVTEMEILHGVLNDPRAAGHAMFYLRDPAWVDSLPEVDRSTYLEESSQGTARLAALRQRILDSEHPATVYPDPAALGEMVLADLTRLVETLYPDAEPPTSRERADRVHAAFGAARFATFVDRPRWSTELDRHVDGDGPPLLITGPSGAGASALVTRWARNWSAAHPGTTVVVHHVDAEPEAADHRALAARLVGALDDGTNDDADDRQLVDADVATVRAAVRRAFRRERAVVVIDGVDLLDDVDGAPDLRWLPTDVPAGVRLILTASGQRPIDAAERRGWRIVTLPPLEPDERRAITATILAAGSKALDPANLDALVAAPSTGNARFLTTVVDELRQHGDHFTLRPLIERLTAAGSLDDLYDLVLERFEHDFDRDHPHLTRHAFTALWAARRGLAESELLELLARRRDDDGQGSDGDGARDDRLPQAVWAPLHLAAERTLVSRAGLLGFGDPGMRRAVERRYLPDDASRRAAHARLASFFRSRPLSGRVTDELGWQQAAASDLDGLRATLSDLGHVELAYSRSAADVRRLWSRLAGTGDELIAGMLDAYRPVLDDPAAHDRPDPEQPEPRQLVWGVARLLSDAGAPGAAVPLHRVLVDAARLDPAGRRDAPGGDAKLRAALINLGAAEMARGELERANAALAEAVDRSRGARDERMLASALGNLAMVRRDLGDRETALGLFAEEEHLCRSLDDEVGLQASLANHAQLLRELGRYDDAMALLREQERVCRELADAAAVARALAGQAAVLADRGDVAAAIEMTERHAGLARSEGDVRGLAEAMSNLASHRLDLGDIDGVRQAADEAEALARRLGDAGLIARILVTRASAHGATGDWKAAERVASEAELTARSAGATRLVATALNVVGTARRERGDTDGARSAHSAGLEAARAGGDDAGVAIAQTELGNVAVVEQRFDEALQWYAPAEQVIRRLDVPASLLPLLANRGQVHQMLGRHSEAVADFTDAADAAARLGRHDAVRQWAEPALGLAYQIGDMARAETLWHLLAGAARASGDDSLLQRALGDAALLLIGRAQSADGTADLTLLGRAAAMLDEQEQICRRIGDDVGLAACIGNRAIVLRYQGDLDGSLRCLDDQLAIAERTGNAQGALIATANRGEVLGLLGRRAEALDALRAARATASTYGLAPMVQQLDVMIAGVERS